MKIVEFLKKHENWEELLGQKPYSIKISHGEWNGSKLMCLKYDQTHSDFSFEEVRECRGLILEEDSFLPFSVPFFKFGNYGESYVPEIDWKTACVAEKIDGSLIKVVRKGEKLCLSTNSTIDAFSTEISQQIGCECRSYGELALKAFNSVLGREEKSIHAYSDLFQENYTYMFELTSPFNQVVVKWKEISLHFIGLRNNLTLQEENFWNHPLGKLFPIPKIYPLTSLEECLEATKEMGEQEEGFVVMDSSFQRVKIKSPMYISLHHAKREDSNVLSLTNVIHIVAKGEEEEFLTYFPQYREEIEKIKQEILNLENSFECSCKGLKEGNFPSRKEQAQFIQTHFQIPSVGFAYMSGKISSIREWILQKDAKDLEGILKI